MAAEEPGILNPDQIAMLEEYANADDERHAKDSDEAVRSDIADIGNHSAGRVKSAL